MIDLKDLDPQHPSIRLADGSVLPLPKNVDLHEFALPGNSREFPQFLAFHDPISSTGAFYSWSASLWQTIWPCKAGEFWRYCVLLAQQQAGDKLAVTPSPVAPHAIRH